jgi:hypothetical protein
MLVLFYFGGSGDVARIERFHMAVTAAQQVAAEFSLNRPADLQRSSYLRLSGQSKEIYQNF